MDISKLIDHSGNKNFTNGLNLKMSISDVENHIEDFIKQSIDKIGSEELILFKEILELLTEMKIYVK